MSEDQEAGHVADVADVTEARKLFPATDMVAYFITAAVGLASSAVAAAYHGYVDEWAERGLDWARGEAAAENARSSVASLLGADASDIALIASVSAAAGLVAAQFGPGRGGQNIVIGEREYSSNHFPWRLLARKGYEVRQVPFRHGGLEPGEVARHVDDRTQLVAFSAVQTATGHRSDIPAISALAHDGGASFFGPTMELSTTASRFDNSISWLAAVGNEASLSVFDAFGSDAIYRRNRELSTLLRAALAEVGWPPADVPEASRSTIVSVPLRDTEPASLLAELRLRGVSCSARDGNLRPAVHFYNHEDDIGRVAEALSTLTP